jgi:predicted NodU family carbamoyl transferase
MISRRFHNGLVQGFVELAILLRNKTTLNRVCLSGGTFHNVYLAQRLEAQLSRAGFEVFTQKEVPCGDGGLSLGQAVVAAQDFGRMSRRDGACPVLGLPVEHGRAKNELGTALKPCPIPKSLHDFDENNHEREQYQRLDERQA